jgi:nucleoside-triphosphatase
MVLMNVLITGKPGCGKTTLIKKMLPHFYGASGFFTEEIRERGVRVGFSIHTLDGFHGILAHKDSSSPIKVGRYGVNLIDIEESCRHVGRGTVIIDEIGKMELHSATFRKIIIEKLEEQTLCATIMEAPHPFCDMVKSRKDVTLYRLTLETREEIFRSLREIATNSL